MFKAKKIGNLLLYCLWWAPLLCAKVEVDLSVLDDSNKSTTTMLVNEANVIQVTVSGQEDGITMPEIEGIGDFLLIGKSMTSTVNMIVNGVRSSKKVFQFVVQPKNIGTYTIGPASIKVQNKKISSNTLKVKVVKEVQRNAQDPRLVLLVDNPTIYVGQPAVLSVRLYLNKEASLEGVTSPDLSNFIASPVEGPFGSKEKVQDEEVSYMEWRTTIMGKAAGNYTIAPLTAMYKVQRKKSSRSNSMFIGFDPFDQFFGLMEEKKTFSQPLTIQVLPLPNADRPCDGVGFVQEIVATVEPQTALKGEGVVYKLSVRAPHNALYTFNFPKLKLPESLKYYESKSYVQKHTPDKTTDTHVFEYILQGSKEGAYVIEPREFCVFNYEKATYEIISSNKVELIIKENQGPKVDDVLKDQKEQVDIKSTDEIVQLVPLITDGHSHFYYERAMNVYLWIMLIMAPLGLFLSYYILQYLYNLLSASFFVRRKRIFNYARKKLAVLKKQGDTTRLYDIFIQVYLIKEGISHSDFAHENLHNWMCSLMDNKNACSKFLDMLLVCSFGNNELSLSEKDLLFNEAEKWLMLLEERMR